ncbi:MAG: sigma-E processing peptidase SpoIIGA [Bacteroides sp.]|nr:sigma-E processing peptidase SpoIIGA [Eubacterium sp.]MCM1418371.1 sigma-E processing peptidase SpoIIGA [Roseburia sp.]MCM1462472.1 sigma-E processing peptidase SpoIIGA [Bacteroides sp.]
MVVYIDVLIVVNVYVTYFTLRAAARLLRERLKTRRLILASVFGGLSSATAAFSFPFFGAVLLKAGFTLLLTLAAFGFSGLRRFFLRFFAVLGVGMLICGTAILLREWAGSAVFSEAGGYVYLNVSIPILVGGTTGAYFLVLLLRRFLDRPSADARLSLKIRNNGKSVVLVAYPDSGNHLHDFLTGLPVIVCRAGAIRPIAPEGIDAADAAPPSGIRLIPYSTVGGGGCIAAFRAEEITVTDEAANEKTVEALIGVGKELGDGDFDAIINPKLLL